MSRPRIEPLPRHRDDRGAVANPLPPDEAARHPRVHVVWNAPGAVRGNHRHPNCDEILVVEGPARVRLRTETEEVDEEVGDGEIVRVYAPRGTVHAVRTLGERTRVLVAFQSEPEEGEVETVREELL